MNALVYLPVTSIKNSIKQLKNKPSRLVGYLVVACIFVMLLFTSFLSPEPDRENFPQADIHLFGVIVIALGLLFFGLYVYQGLSRGSSFFSLPDANLLFCAPVSPKRILVYGLLKQMGVTILASVFIVFQLPNLRNFFGLGADSLVYIFIGYVLMLFLGNLFCIWLYSTVSQSPSRKKVVKVILAALAAAVLIWFGVEAASTKDLYGSVIKVFDSFALTCIPIMGWIKGFIMAAIAGSWVEAIIWLVLSLAGGGLMILGVLRSDADYYEDILLSTETTYQTKQAQKEGNLNMSMGKAKVRKGDTGLKGGKGASTLFYRRLRENRKKHILWMDGVSLVYLAIALLFGFIFREEMQAGDLFPPLFILGMSAYMGIIFSCTTGFVKAITKPYIYLIPQSPFQKLLWSAAYDCLKPFGDALLVYGVLALAGGCPPLTAISCGLTFGSFSSLYACCNILMQRIFGSGSGKSAASRLTKGQGMLFLLYMLAVMILLIPGIVVSVIVSFALPSSIQALGVLALFVWNMGLSAVVLVLSRNVLNNMES